MTTATRYNLEAVCTVVPINGEMYPNPEGFYVLYTDHAKVLETLLETLKKSFDALMLADSVMDCCRGDVWERERTMGDREKFVVLLDEITKTLAAIEQEEE